MRDACWKKWGALDAERRPCEQVVDATLIAIMINTFANITITIVIIVSLLVVQYYYPSKSSSSQYSSPG